MPKEAVSTTLHHYNYMSKTVSNATPHSYCKSM